MSGISIAGEWSYTDVMSIIMGSAMMMIMFRMLVRVLTPVLREVIRIEDKENEK